MNGTLTPKLGDYRFSVTRETEVYVLVDGAPTWRAAEWVDRADYLYLRNGRTPYPYWVARPILVQSEVLRETVDRVIEIITIPA